MKFEMNTQVMVTTTHANPDDDVTVVITTILVKQPCFVLWLQKQMEDKIAELEVEKEKALSDRDKLWEQKWKDRVQYTVVLLNVCVSLCSNFDVEISRFTLSLVSQLLSQFILVKLSNSQLVVAENCCTDNTENYTAELLFK